MQFRLPAKEEKADYVLKQFDRIAWRYDLANDAISFGMHRLWKAKALAAMALKPTGRYLDVCCGTGDLTLGIVQHLTKDGRVVGIDFSNNMLSIAAGRSKVLKPSEQAQIEWVCADAQKLPFENNSFDGAIISFGLRNLSDLKMGIQEMARVVKPGGAVINLDLGHPTMPVFTSFYHFYFKHIVPLLGSVLVGDLSAYKYLPSSLDTYPKPDGITAIFVEAKLNKIIYQPLALGTVALHTGIVPE